MNKTSTVGYATWLAIGKATKMNIYKELKKKIAADVA